MASPLRVIADTKRFSAQKFYEDGYCLIETGMTATELNDAASSARRIAASSASEFIRVTGNINMDKKRLVRAYSSVKPLIEALFGGAKHPGSDLSPYGFHNLAQIALREPGAAGQDGIRNLRSMTSPLVAHIDQPHKRQLPRGKPICNFSVLVGILLEGETAERSDAGNLWVSRGSHILLGKAFNEVDGPPRFYTPHIEALPQRVGSLWRREQRVGSLWRLEFGSSAHEARASSNCAPPALACVWA